MSRFSKNQKGLALIYLIIIVLVIIIVAVLAKNVIGNIYIENVTLTKENIEETLEKYSEMKKDTDDLAYVGYALAYHTTIGYMSNIFNFGASEDVIYANIYGKSINDLKKEGKELMEDNNVTLDDFKKSMTEQ